MSITLEQVSKEYSDSIAINDVTAQIAEGELFVLLGPSGSGKSTLLRAIAGLTTIDHGRIVLHGRDVTDVGARDREVGFVFQNYALFRHMTVADNIEFGLRTDEHLEAWACRVAGTPRGDRSPARAVPSRSRDSGSTARSRHRSVPGSRPDGNPARAAPQREARQGGA
jgi:ABC-type sugar transport system ATPase subunit